MTTAKNVGSKTELLRCPWFRHGCHDFRVVRVSLKGDVWAGRREAMSGSARRGSPPRFGAEKLLQPAGDDDFLAVLEIARDERGTVENNPRFPVSQPDASLLRC